MIVLVKKKENRLRATTKKALALEKKVKKSYAREKMREEKGKKELDSIP